MPKVSNQWWRALLFGLLFVIGYKIIDNFSKILDYAVKLLDILTPFIIGVSIAFFLHRPVVRLAARLSSLRPAFLQKHARAISIFIVYLLVLFVCFFVISYLVEAITQNIAEIISNWDMISRRAMEIFDRVNLPQKREWLDKVNAFLTNLLETEILFKAGNIVGSLASILTSVFTGLIISVYTILEKDSLKALFVRGLHFFLPTERAIKVRICGHRLVHLFRAYFTGLAIDAFLVGALSTCFYIVYETPYAWLLGLVAGVGNLVPFFGPIVASLLIALVSLIAQGPMRALWVLLFQLVLGQVDANVIQPRIVGNSVGISPFWVIFAVLFFGGIWGVWGMLLGVPIVATVRMFFLMPAVSEKTK